MAVVMTSLASNNDFRTDLLFVTLAAGEQVAVAMARHAARTYWYSCDAHDLLAPCALGFPGHFGGKLEHCALVS